MVSVVVETRTTNEHPLERERMRVTVPGKRAVFASVCKTLALKAGAAPRLTDRARCTLSGGDGDRHSLFGAARQ